MRGRRLVGLIVSLIAIGLGSAIAYHLTVTPVSLEFSGETLDCGRLDDGGFGGGLLCLDRVDDLKTRRVIAIGAAVIGAMGVVGLWRSRFDRTERIVGHGVSLRPATAADRRTVEQTMSPAIVEAHGWTHQEINGFIEVLGVATLGRVYLVEPVAPSPHAGQVVGCMMATPGPDGAWWIGGWIAEPSQRLGYGAGAVAAVTDWLFDQGVRNIHAECSASNQAVRSMLERLGYEHMGELRTRLPDDRLEQAIRYAKHTMLPLGYDGYRPGPGPLPA